MRELGESLITNFYVVGCIGFSVALIASLIVLSAPVDTSEGTSEEISRRLQNDRNTFWQTIFVCYGCVMFVALVFAGMLYDLGSLFGD